MKDSHALKTLLAVLFCLVPTLCLGRDDKNSEPYHPTKVGTKWAVRFHRGGVNNYEVTAVEVEKDGSKVVTVYERSVRKEPFVIVGQEPKDEVFESFEKLRISAKGIQTVATKGNDDAWKKDESSAPLPHALKAGDTWVHKIPNTKDEAVYSVGKTERVKVPAGTFDAVPLYVEGTQNGRKLPKRTFWCVPGIGVIKSMIGDELGVELISFTLPKK